MLGAPAHMLGAPERPTEHLGTARMDDAVLAVTRVGIIGGGQIEHLDAALVDARSGAPAGSGAGHAAAFDR